MSNLIVPVYLNQKLVFDLLAMLQGGLSTVTTVTEVKNNSEDRAENLSSGFGLSEAFSTLLKIDISGSKATNKTASDSSTESQERVHTPSSLFYQLRNLLIEKEHVEFLSADGENVKSGDFVEFEGYLKRNPLLETIDTLASLLEFAEVFQEEPQKLKKGKQPIPKESENQKLLKQMEDFAESLKTGNTIDLFVELSESDHSAVITVETAYLNDPLMSDIVDGKFKVIGKVIKSVDDSTESINLLRKSVLGKLPTALLFDAMGKMGEVKESSGVDLPELKVEISGPAIQVIPIAIYA